MKKVNRQLLEAVAHTKPVLPHPGRGKKYPNNDGKAFDVAEFIARHSIEVAREGDWNKTGHRWILAECPWNGHTDHAAYIVQFSNGAIAAGCHHDSCQGYGWRDFREHYEPGTYDHDHDEADTEAAASNSHPTPPAQPAVKLPDVPPFPLNSLPPSLRNLVEETAKAVVCPPDRAGSCIPRRPW